MVDSGETPLSDYVRVRSRDLFKKSEHFREWRRDFRDRKLEKRLLQYQEFRGGTAIVCDPGTGESYEVQVYCSADYLDLARHPEVVSAAKDAMARFGVSVSSVPLIAGATILNEQLEAELASFLGTESAVLFPTGHAANVSTIAAFCTDRNDTVVCDNQVHYSVLEGVKVSKAALLPFAHSDLFRLDEVLKSVRCKRPDDGILLVVEGVYGLDGDIAPLPSILEVARRYDVRLMVDDAHGIGVIGEQGRGSTRCFSEVVRADILMGSLSKALGSFGGFVAASKDVVDYLRYFAKSIGFSVGLPPANVAAALTALRIIRSTPSLIESLSTRCDRMRSALLEAGFDDVSRSQSAIMSILVGSLKELNECTKALFERSIWIESLPYPAVPNGLERIRFRMRPSHSDEQIDFAVRTVRDVGRNYTFGGRRVAAVGRIDSLRGSSVIINKLLRLIYDSNSRKGLPSSCFTQEAKRKQIERSGYWKGLHGEQRWFYKGGDELSAALCAAVVPRQKEESGKVGVLGHFTWLPDADDDIAACIDEGVTWLRDSCEVDVVYAPVQTPIQLAGGGMPLGTFPTSDRPFLDQGVDPLLTEILIGKGFEVELVRVCAKIDLAQDEQRIVEDITFRRVNRECLQAEIIQLAEIANHSISTMALSQSIPNELFFGAAHELRGLIVPGLWIVAIEQERIVGFVIAFPNVTEAFERAGGVGDVADIDNINDAIGSVDMGYVAWLGVCPSVQRGDTIAKLLLQRVFDNMIGRGFKRTWLSWCLHDGKQQLTPDHFPDMRVIERREYSILALRFDPS